jgi:threonine dehydrogenase-like Zn-dependent dehydrogenase
MNRQGALAERLVVPSSYAWPITGAPRDLVCVEPTTVVLAALRRLPVPVPNAVFVVGVGAQGLLMSLALLERRVAVHVHDVNADRVAFASDLGATPTSSADADLRFDLVVDTVGSPASVATALERVEVGGTLLFLGLDSRPLELSAQTLVRRQLHLQGSLTYDHPADFEAAIALIGGGGFAPGQIVGDDYPLDGAQVAFETGGTAVGKTWIRIAEPADKS